VIRSSRFAVAKRSMAARPVFTVRRLTAQALVCALLAPMFPVSAQAQTAVAIQPPNLSGAVAGAVPGSAGVGGSGAATYSVPIKLPPGTAGIAPTLSLSYSSQGGEGLLGVGWSVGGLSSITRCAATIAVDGVAGRVGLDANDRYCLDGQRLLLVSGTYGATAEYRTEIDGISRVTSTGSDPAAGPSSWKVESRSGHTLSYGTSADSFVEASNSTKAMSWAVKRVQDRRGNYYVVDYTENTATGEHYPNQIRYTGNDATGLAPYNAVRFEYGAATRPDLVVHYAGGSRSLVMKRLDKISAWINTAADGSGGTEASELRVGYTQSSSSLRSLVNTLTLCDGSNQCLPATSFGWQQRTSAHNNFAAAGSGVWGGPNPIYHTTQHYLKEVLQSVKQADMNGDGRMDLIKSNENGTWQVCLSTGATFSCSNWAGPNVQSKNAVMGDLNGDGRTDLVYPGSTSAQVCLSTGSSFDCQTWPLEGTTNSNGTLAQMGASVTYQTGDFTGDGIDDLAVRTNLFGGNKVCRSTGSAFDCSVPGLSGLFDPNTVYYLEPENHCAIYTGSWNPNTGDFNGDRKLDVLVAAYLDPACKNTSGEPADNSFSLSAYGGTSTPVVTGLGKALGFIDPPGTIMGDFNGDGLQDFLLQGLSPVLPGKMKLCLSRGDGTSVDCNDYIPTATNDSAILTVADFDGDGRPDVLQPTGLCQVISGTLNCTPWTWPSNPGADEVGPIYGDFDGDGKTDLAFLNRTSGQWRVALAAGPTPDLLASVTTGLGHVTQFDYANLGNAAVYTPGAAVAYPKRNVNSGMNVVSQMRVTNAQGGWFATNYQYEAYRTDLQGRGGLGFQKTRSIDTIKNVTTQTTVSQDFPTTGMPMEVKATQQNGVVLSLTTNTLSAIPTASSTPLASLYPYVSHSVVAQRDLNGAVMPERVSDIPAGQVDVYGNVGYSSETVSDSASGDQLVSITANTYEAKAGLWPPTVLKRSQVSKTGTWPGVSAPPPVLTLSGCTSNNGTTSPTAATMSCTLVNNSATAVTAISYVAPSGLSASGPATCAANTNCGTVTVTTGTAAGRYQGSLHIVPTPAGGEAALDVDLTVNATPPALVLEGCTGSGATTSPVAATLSCVLRNNGQSAATSIAYAAAGAAAVNGPTSCAGSTANCGTVTVTSGTAAGTYSGTVTATPTPAGSGGSAPFSLVVNTPPTPPQLRLSCNSPAATTTPTPVTMSCTLDNLGQTTTAVSYGVPVGFSVSGPASCAGGTLNCGTVQVTTPTGPATYTGTLTATPAAGGTGASAAINLTVNPTPPALTLTGCSAVTPSIAPTVATLSCTLGNSGQTAASVSYGAPANTSVSGPTSCAGSTANCGTVTLSTAGSAGSYTGTLSASPSPAGTAASVAVSLTVNTPPALAFSGCSAPSSAVTPTQATASCTLSNSGQTAASSIGYAAPSGVSVSGPTSCAAGSTCGTVTATSGTAAGNYGGTLSATPTPGGTAASTSLSLTVNPAVPVMSVSPATIDLGLTSKNGVSATKVMTVSNTGAVGGTVSWSLAYTSGSAVSGDLSVSRITCTSGGTVAPGGSCTLGVSWLAGCTNGTRVAKLTIQGANYSPLTVQITGATGGGSCN